MLDSLFSSTVVINWVCGWRCRQRPRGSG